jgi:NHL repeat
VLPFTGLHEPAGIAVDKGGSVYVADKGNTRRSNYWPGQPPPRHVVDVDAHQAHPMSLIERCARRRALSNSLESDHI